MSAAVAANCPSQNSKDQLENIRTGLGHLDPDLGEPLGHLEANLRELFGHLDPQLRESLDHVLTKEGHLLMEAVHVVVYLHKRIAEVLRSLGSQLVAETEAKIRSHHSTPHLCVGLTSSSTTMPSSRSLVKRDRRHLHAILSALMFAPNARAALAVVIATTSFAAGCSRPPQLAADLVITHARVWTGLPSQPDAAAVAIIGDRIVDVGAADAIERWRGPNTTIVDAGGRRVVPGFNDAAVRLVDGGVRLEGVDLRDAPSATEMARRINERAKARPGEWITRWRLGRTILEPAIAAGARVDRRGDQLVAGVRHAVR